MDEEKGLPSLEPQEPEPKQNPAPPRPRSSRRKQQRSRQSVFQYIAVLFAADFVLLLFTLLMERRQHEQQQEENQEQITNLQNSVSGLQSLKGLLEENETLKARVAGLEAGLEERTAELEQEQSRLQAVLDSESEARDSLEKTTQAMDWFWQINEAFVRGRYTTCRTLIQSLKDAGLEEYLPTQSATGNGRFSPYDRYMEIQGKVIK